MVIKTKEQMKEEIFNLIDDYMDLKNKQYVIRITDRRKNKAFGILMDSTEGFGSYKKEEYSINGIIKRRLDKNKIKYKIIRAFG